MYLVEKRNGVIVAFEVSRIAEAIEKAGLAQEEAVRMATDIAGWCHAEYDSPYSIGDIQATVIRELGKQGYEDVQSKYKVFRRKKHCKIQR